jgi:hypothetical protein
LFIFPGVIGNYPGSGFLIDFAASSEKRQAQLGYLQEAHWIDIKTRAVFLDMAFYNPNTDLFVTIRILFEFHSCGTVSMMPTYRIMRLDKYPMNDLWNYIEMGAQGGVALMVRRAGAHRQHACMMRCAAHVTRDRRCFSILFKNPKKFTTPAQKSTSKTFGTRWT